MNEVRSLDFLFDGLVESTYKLGTLGPKNWVKAVEMEKNGDDCEAASLYLSSVDDAPFYSFLREVLHDEGEILEMSLNRRMLLLKRYFDSLKEWKKNAA